MQGPAGPLGPSPTSPLRTCGLCFDRSARRGPTCAAARAAETHLQTCLLHPRPLLRLPGPPPPSPSPQVQLRLRSWVRIPTRCPGVTSSPLGAGRSWAPGLTGRVREGVEGHGRTRGFHPGFTVFEILLILALLLPEAGVGPLRDPPPPRPHCGFPMSHTVPRPAPACQPPGEVSSPSSPVSSLGRQPVPEGYFLLGQQVWNRPGPPSNEHKPRPLFKFVSSLVLSLSPRAFFRVFFTSSQIIPCYKLLSRGPDTFFV